MRLNSSVLRCRVARTQLYAIMRTMKEVATPRHNVIHVCISHLYALQIRSLTFTLRSKQSLHEIVELYTLAPMHVFTSKLLGYCILSHIFRFMILKAKIIMMKFL